MTKTPTRSKSCYLDANILVYFSNAESPQFKKATNILLELRSRKFHLYTSSLALDEFIHTISNIHYINFKSKIETDKLIEILKKITSLPTLKIINAPEDITSQLKIPTIMNKFKLSPRDAYHILTIRHHKIKYFATFDSDFNLVFKNTSLKEFTY